MSEIPNPAEEQNRAWETGYQEGAAEVAARVEAFLPAWVPDLDPRFLRDLRETLRGDA